MTQIRVSNILIDIEPYNKGVKLTFPSFCQEFDEIIKVLCNREEIMSLISILEPLATKTIKQEEKAYTEEISTYANEVERALYLTGCNGNLQMRLDCYTDKAFDDNWIVLSSSKLSYLVGLLYGYL